MTDRKHLKPKCPKCGSGDYYYDGLFILCCSCGYTEWAKKIGGELEDLIKKWSLVKD